MIGVLDSDKFSYTIMIHECQARVLKALKITNVGARICHLGRSTRLIMLNDLIMYKSVVKERKKDALELQKILKAFDSGGEIDNDIDCKEELENEFYVRKGRNRKACRKSRGW